MEFKGSKGNWKAIFVEENVRAIRNEGGIIIRFWKPFKYSGQDERFDSELKETQANQKLCLHAPEMLEILRYISNQLSLDDLPKYDKLTKDINTLIKEATTI